MGAGLVCAFLLSMPAAAQRAPRTIAPTPAPDGQSAPRETAPRVIPPTPEVGPGPGQGERPQRSHPTGPTVGKIVVEGTQRIDPTRSEEHTSELQSLMRISYAVFCLTNQKKKNKPNNKETS